MEEHEFTDEMCRNLLDNIFPSRIYKRLARRRNRLQQFKDLNAPQVIIDEEKRLITKAEKKLLRIIDIDRS